MPKEAEVPLQTCAAAEASLLRQVLLTARTLAATIGTDFFHSVVSHLAVTFHADFVYLAEVAGAGNDRIRALAIFPRHRKSKSFEQKLKGTAAGQVVVDGSFACMKDVMRWFPDDTFLRNIRAEGFAGILLTDSAGQPLGVLGIVSTHRLDDIGLVKSVLVAFAPRAAAELERKRADDILRENEERYHAFISTNPDAMWRIEFEQPIPIHLEEEELVDRIYDFGYLGECNDAFARLAGRETADQMVGRRFGEIAPRTDARALSELRAVVRSGFSTTAVETIPVKEAGRISYRLRSQFGIVVDGMLRRIWFTTRDISQLRCAELSLAASERRFGKVLEGIHLPAVMIDLQGKITFANEYFVRLAQRTAEDLSARVWLDGVIPDAEAETWRMVLAQDEQGRHAAVHFEGTLFSHDGQARTIVWDTLGLQDEQSQLVGLAAIGRDITSQKVLEMEIRQAQKLEGIGRLAAGIAHDFNNLLMVVMQHADLLLKQSAESDPARERLATIVMASTECSKLIAQLLAFSRKQHLRPRLVSLNDVVVGEERITRSLIGEGIELDVDLGTPLGLVYADPAQLQRVLANLVTNARDAMPNGGKLTIATSSVTIGPEDDIYPGIAPGPHVRLSVSDSGIGMTEEIRTHIFEPFYTTKAPGKGTGLGLSTVYGIVAQSGGHIAVRSRQEHGSTFEILLPIATKQR